MNNIPSSLTIIFLFSLWSCDTIEPPYKEPPPPTDTNTVLKTVMIEKFTGHKCAGCAIASEKIDELKEIYPGKIIPIYIHPDLSPLTNPSSNYPYDFRTDDGSQIANDLGVPYIPLGTINRLGGNSNTIPECDRCWLKDSWASLIDTILYDNNNTPKLPEIEISINNILNLTKNL